MSKNLVIIGAVIIALVFGGFIYLQSPSSMVSTPPATNMPIEVSPSPTSEATPDATLTIQATSNGFVPATHEDPGRSVGNLDQ